MKSILSTLLLILSPMLLAGQNSSPKGQFKPITDSIQLYMEGKAAIHGAIKIDRFTTNSNREITFFFSRSLSEYPIRDNDVKAIYRICRHLMPGKYKGYTVKAFSCNTPLEQLSSKYYSGRKPVARTPVPTTKWVENISVPYKISKGLQNRHIALWQSHGFYYEQKLMRWEWQRARIFQTVEDLYTQSYVVPFLAPMLENAGAYVAMPRERDVQTQEIIVDNDLNASELRGIYNEELGRGGGEWINAPGKGFANPKKVYLTGENPFKMGTARIVKMVEGKKNNDKIASFARWIPKVAETGAYAVYISYPSLENSSSAVEYIVRHNGGSTRFIVNQTMGGGTWVYLGTFGFNRDDPEQGVTMLNTTPFGKKHIPGKVAAADAVKFGGGMGNIARAPQSSLTLNQQSAVTSSPAAASSVPSGIYRPETSGYPRFTEGARYWLQWAGYEEEVYTPNENKNDYNDDYMSRGQWVNALCGGSRVNPGQKGKKVPIDMAMAFHSDAGTTLSDSLIGTLAIYTKMSEGKETYPSGEKRMLSRELADLIQTQIVNDIRSTYEENWVRRGLWDKSYHESRTPAVPCMLLELLSHQNFADMRYGLDPRFRFVVSRAVYKGILRFLAEKDGYDYVVQPLPVNSFSASLVKSKNGNATVRLSWKPTPDPKESTAMPTRYVVYTKEMNSPDEIRGFDNGTVIEGGTECLMNIKKGKIYSYRVVPVNNGGAGFPSEILSVGYRNPEAQTVMIVNGFDRISAPASFATKDSTIAGFVNRLDSGVPYINDFSFIGAQHEYRRNIPWMDDDAPGFGASFSNYEDKEIAGNTFNYPLTHGIAVYKAGYNFVSSSRDAVTAGDVDLKAYPIADFIMGKQVKYRMGREGANDIAFEVFPALLQEKIKEYCNQGGNILVSGSYIATDIWDDILSKETPHKSKSDRVNDMKRTVQRLGRQLNTLSGQLKEMTDEAAATVNHHIDLNLQSTDALLKQLSALKDEIAHLEKQNDPDQMAKDFAINTLKYKWMTHYASSTGEVKSVDNPLGIYLKTGLSFHNTPNKTTYHIEHPDGLVPAGKNAYTIMRYADNNISAAVAYKGSKYSAVSLGFPIETLKSQKEINALMNEILEFLSK